MVKKIFASTWNDIWFNTKAAHQFKCTSKELSGLIKQILGPLV